MLFRQIIVVLGVSSALATAAAAQTPCPTTSKTYGASTELSGGGEHSRLKDVLIQPPGGAPKPDSHAAAALQTGADNIVVLQELQAKITEAPGTKVFFDFTNTNGSVCRQEVEFPGFGGTGAGSGSGTTGTGSQQSQGRPGNLADCASEAGIWAQELSAQMSKDGNRSQSGFTLLAFTESGEICYANRYHGVSGEPIFIGVYSAAKTKWQPMRFEPCSIERETPAIFVSAESVNLSGGRLADVWSLRRHPARTCYNASVAISATADANAGSISFTLGQNQLYRGTLQLGALFTDQHVQSFDVGTINNENVVFSKGPTGRGVDYTVSLVLYALPRYVLSLGGGKAYSGRDLVHDQGVLDRVGLVLGVGLKDPGRRFIAGGSFEVMYGVNIMYVADVFRSPRLVNAELDKPFSGTVNDLKTQDQWNAKGTFGVSVDLLYVTELFSGRIRP